jgi:flavin reductase (DIM6/NTAB) family NADH-FMN oxidoreductase RutF
MKHYNANELPVGLAYKLLSATVIPRPIAWVVTKNKETEKLNAAPFSFFNVIGPGYVSLSVMAGPYGEKDTAKNLHETGEATIQLVNEENILNMNKTAASLPHDISEVEEFHLETTESSTVDVQGLLHAPVRFEVKLVDSKKIFDEENGFISELFILKVTDYYVDEKIFDETRFHIDNKKYGPVARLAGNNYASLGHIFELTRPQ